MDDLALLITPAVSVTCHDHGPKQKGCSLPGNKKNMSGASSVFRMGDGVMDKWKVFRRKSCDFAALVLKIDSDNEQVVVSHSDV